jgi:hypothetical protein
VGGCLRLQQEVSVKTRRVIVFSVCAMGVLLGLFLWQVLWYGDIMPNNPPASPYENAFSLVCTLSMWLFVVAAAVFGKDPPVVLWLPLWVLTGLFWGLLIEWLRNAATRLTARTQTSNGRRFWKSALIQVGIWLVACGLWFYVRASTILAHPTDPENYGNFGNNWRFQWFAFLMSRLLPTLFGLFLLLLAEWYVGLVVASRRRPAEVPES